MANKTPEIPDCNRPPMKRVTGENHWGEFTPNRSILPLPAGSKGPIRAREVRASKDPNAPALDHHGTPQLPSTSKPPRG
jgi:hypothetical protein